LNVHGVSDVRQIEIHTADYLIPDPRPFEFQIAVAKMKRYKSAGSDQILAELIQGGGEILCSKVHTLINFVSSKEKLLDQWKGSIIVQIHKKGDKTDYSNFHGISLL
jgi:hypothetical protein